MNASSERAGDEELRVVLGATATGKTAFALALAERAGAEIVSLDSMLVYRGMDVGTAKPPAAERARIPHHALDLVPPSTVFTVQDYLAAAQAALEDVRRRGGRALFVGGTAFYYKALTQGLFEGPDVDSELRGALERRYEREGADALHRELARVDSLAARRIHANDKKRVVRALEVFEQTGRPLSDWQREWGWGEGGGASPIGRPRRVVELCVPAPELDRRIAERTRRMLDGGWVEEALAVRAAGGFSATSRQALGYADVLELADGVLSRAEAEERIALRTRQFSRRQRTWLRKFTEARRIEAPENAEDRAEVLDAVLAGFGW